MSAWIVTDEHIRVLLWAGLEGYPPRSGNFTWYFEGKWHTLTQTTAPQVGAMLKRQNGASVNYRYCENKGYRYTHGAPAWTGWGHGAVLKAIDCYDYQSCETADWSQTSAAAFCGALRDKIGTRLSDYADAPWGIEPTSHEQFQTDAT